MAPVVLILLIVFVLAPIARASAERLRRSGREALPGGGPEVARLREEVDRLGAEVARLTEEQAFMLRLLAPGAAPGDDPAGGPSPVPPGDPK